MKNSGCSISLDSLVMLTIVLVVLKATGYLSCSWWWCFAPLWLPVVLAMAVMGFIELFAIIFYRRGRL